ncbi:predicted protein [Naegleria gruberi]|uniref:Predicted protein n=1 Tax=Naegleria gruberi TaxID=5762 RepID=D2W3U5_NAEGR|nr:uncharacterized protein NAEGRDRAFT_76069 [Naegleria gruberi]EFC36233.1 predicted protein [Naegleria gruberi]|eukprot:XP_002668977.1 predicted protein [Naegleria gruberi strain NEG-M]
MSQQSNLSLPIIDIGPIIHTTDSDGNYQDEQAAANVIKQIGQACERFGFFYIKNHGIDEELVDKLMSEGRSFFNKPLDYKNQYHMKNSKVYRGYFELGGELTKLGHSIMAAIGESLGLGRDFFRNKFTSEPFIPFRLFHYPSDPNAKFENGEERFGVGKHQDYGCLTLLKQDNVGGLEVEDRSTGEWISAPPLEKTFVVNIGDMLERWTCGRYKAVPHRVKNLTNQDRLSAPFFFDPNFECVVTPLEELALTEEEKTKWPPVKYGDYILAKVFAVFPELKSAALKYEE